jgi:Protein of unknown function (DUF3263)
VGTAHGDEDGRRGAGDMPAGEGLPVRGAGEPGEGGSAEGGSGERELGERAPADGESAGGGSAECGQAVEGDAAGVEAPRESPGEAGPGGPDGESGGEEDAGAGPEGGREGEAGAEPSVAGALSERDLVVLELARRTWLRAGAKERVIRERLGVSAARYYQLLNALIDRPEALAHDPVTVNRLRRMREARRGRR